MRPCMAKSLQTIVTLQGVASVARVTAQVVTAVRADAVALVSVLVGVAVNFTMMILNGKTVSIRSYI